MHGPGPIPTSPEVTYTSNFKAYTDMYSNAEQRRQGGLAVVQSVLTGAELPNSNLLVRNVLNAHWGQDRDSIEYLAHALYRLRDKLPSWQNNSVMVVRHGELPTDGEEPTVDLPIEVEVGVLKDTQFQFFFNGTLDESAKPKGRVVPPYIGFGVALAVKDRQRLEINYDGTARVTTPRPLPVNSQYAEDGIMFYQGLTSLAEDREAHCATGAARNHDILIGNQISHEALRRLVEVGPMDAFDNYFERLRKAKDINTPITEKIDTKKPLPDLTKIFGTPPVEEDLLDEDLAS